MTSSLDRTPGLEAVGVAGGTGPRMTSSLDPIPGLGALGVTGGWALYLALFLDPTWFGSTGRGGGTGSHI